MAKKKKKRKKETKINIPPSQKIEHTYCISCKKYTWEIYKQMLSYCYYCHDYTKDINTGPKITKNKLILNKAKCFKCNHKSKHYKILPTQNFNDKC